MIRQDAKTGARSLDRLWWGLIPYWCKDDSRARKPINAKSETIATLATFRDAYRRRRCLLPIDSFFEWKAVRGAAVKQPFAIGMRSGEPFAFGGHLGQLETTGDLGLDAKLRHRNVSCQ